ncbi:hypothetical protein [Phaeobacter sp. B1627]|uniref:hypothetical protein n=1 Tax=Phaeobacter sp. B1627 TaxID=2583809 RepID=UPI00210777F8|nr:hypothetical protein [Phaeobacter sp. B1627]
MIQSVRHPFRPAKTAPLIAVVGVVAVSALMTFGTVDAVLAQTTQGDSEVPQAEGDGKSLMERGADLFLRGLRREMEPALEDAARLFAEIGPALREFLAEMGPALAAIAEQVEDWSLYERPEILENGDIIMRRKRPLPDAHPPAETPPGDRGDPGEGSIEL